MSVFRATRDAYYSGCDPVLCISQNYDFSGAPHCILPIGWNDSVNPWQILIHDPNFPSKNPVTRGRGFSPSIRAATRTAMTAAGTNTTAARGAAAWYYLPFDLVNERPRTPIYDAIMLFGASS